MISPLLTPSPFLPATQSELDTFASEGLRTLLLAQRCLSQSEYQEYQQCHDDAIHSIGQREEKLAVIYDNIERDLDLVGCTAIEDRLQEGVKETIEFIRSAGIKVWVLTGDKVETAITVGYRCGLLEEDM